MSDFILKSAEEMRKEHEEFIKRRDAIRKKNEALIRKWRSIPWYRFWERPSFEEQRRIIISNWNSVKI